MEQKDIKKKKYEDYRTKVSNGTPLNDKERAEWKTLLKEFDPKTFEKDYPDEAADKMVTPENPEQANALENQVANPTPTPGIGSTKNDDEGDKAEGNANATPNAHASQNETRTPGYRRTR